eukprot:c20296_g2_i1 orf=147-323(-)
MESIYCKAEGYSPSSLIQLAGDTKEVPIFKRPPQWGQTADNPILHMVSNKCLPKSPSI